MIGEVWRKAYFCAEIIISSFDMEPSIWKILFDQPQYLLLLYILVASLFAFIIYGIDKLCAQRNWRRISEISLLMTALLGGSIGALMGMIVWRHKTQHAKFTIGVPFILVLQISLLLWAFISWS